MMRDPYVWRSVEELERERDAARDAGRDEILDRLAKSESGEFKRSILRLIDRAAEDLVASSVLPHLKRAFPGYEHDRLRTETEALLRAMAPFTHHVINTSELGLRSFQVGEDGPLTVRSEVMVPIYTKSIVQVMPSHEQPGGDLVR